MFVGLGHYSTSRVEMQGATTQFVRLLQGVSALGVEFPLLAIRAELDGALLVCAQHLHVVEFSQAVKYSLVRVTKVVFGANRYDGIVRRDCLQKLGCRGAVTAVVGNLEKVCGEERVRLQQQPFSTDFNVTGE